MKIYNQGVLVRDRAGKFSSFKAAVKRFVHKTLMLTALGAFGFLAFVLGGAFNSTDTVIASTQVVEARHLS